jgi:hypothetical protein
MFGFKYVKADPSTHLMLFKKAMLFRKVSESVFFAIAPSSSLVAIPSNSKELPFVSRLQTADFQELSLQEHGIYGLV